MLTHYRVYHVILKKGKETINFLTYSLEDANKIYQEFIKKDYTIITRQKVIIDD